MHKRCREIMDELILSGELEEITWFKFAPKQELKLRLKDMLEDEVDEKYLLNQELVSKYLEKGSQAGKVADENDVFHTVNAGSHGYSMGYVKLKQTHTLNIKGNDSIKRIYSSDGLCPSLTTMQGGHREPKIAHPVREVGRRLDENGKRCDDNKDIPITRRYEIGEKEISNCLSGVQKDSYVATKENIDSKHIFRKLTPRECFRLQGFNDSFIFPPKISSTQLYKQAGNGMSRNILDMIFTQIFKSKNFDLSSNS